MLSTYYLSPAVERAMKIQEVIFPAIKERLKWHQKLASGQAEAILRMRFRSSLPEAPHPFLPEGISDLTPDKTNKDFTHIFTNSYIPKAIPFHQGRRK